MSQSALHRQIDSAAERTIARLQRLCQQPSVSAQGLGMEPCADLVRDLMETSGLAAERIDLPDGPPVLFGEREGECDQTLLFYDHYDVQPPEPIELWHSDPWAAEIRDGKLYARGASDNKSNIISRLAAIEAWLALEGELPCRVKFLIEGEEEIGSPHFAPFVMGFRERLEADGAIWEFGGLDPGDVPAVTLGLKGMLYVELTAQTLGGDTHSARAAIAESPAWRLLRALQTLSDGQGRITIDGWYDRVRPFNQAELAALEGEPLDEEGLKRDLGVSRFLGGLSGLALKQALAGSPTANIAGISSGYLGKGHKTVLPATASAKLDFRLVPDQDPNRMADLLRAHLESHGFGDLNLTIQAENPAARTPLDSPLARIACETGAAIYDREPIVHISSAGSGPMSLFTSELGIPTVAIGCNHARSNTHAPNENQRLDVLISGTKWIADVMGRMVEAPLA